MMIRMYEPFSVVDVLLDEENPRFADPVVGQPEAINALLRLGATKLLNLADDIAVTGELDPTNPPIVMRDGDDVIVLEGNRRFASLKLLRNPDLAVGESTRKAVRKIRTKAEQAGKNADGPAVVTCWVVADRDEAKRWMELRHTGQNEGVGTDPWTSYQSVTFRRRPGTAEDRAWLFVRAVISTFDADTQLLSDVREVRDEKFTNLARLISRPYVRQQMMFDIKGDAVTIDSESNFATDVLRTVFADLKTLTVDDIKSGELQDDYIDGVVAAVRASYPDGNADGDDDGDDSGRSGGAGGGTGGGGGSGGTGGGSAGGSTGANTGAGTSGRRKNPPKGEARIFYGLQLSNVELRTSTILKHAQTVKIDTAPSVCAVMVRIVLEMTVTEIGVSRGWFTEGEKLRKKIRKAILQLDPDAANSMKRDKALDLAWIKTQTDAGDGLAVDEMNAYVHNFMADPTPASVRGLTSIFRPLLQRLDHYAGENPTP